MRAGLRTSEKTLHLALTAVVTLTAVATLMSARQASQLAAAAVGAVRARTSTPEDTGPTVARLESLRSQLVATGCGLELLAVLAALVGAALAARSLRADSHRLEEDTRLQERKAEEMEAFAGRVAHDVLSPLGPVGMSLDLLGQRFPDDPRAQVLVQRGHKSLVRAGRIVEGLLAFARAGACPEPGSEAQMLEVLKGLQDELEPVARASDIVLCFQAPEGCAVACAAGVLASVLQNLLRNAIKYIGLGPQRSVQLRAEARAGLLRVEVEDNGPGLPPGMELEVFKPFVRGPGTGQPGTGLGLATVKRLVESHQGRVGVLSRPGQGCTFWFELPLAAPDARRRAAPERN